MKKILAILYMLCLIIGINGCKKAPINSDIEGLWRLKQFTILETDKSITCQRLYYSITRMVTEVSEKEGPNGYGTYISRTEYRENGTQLVLKDFKVRSSTSDNKQNAPIESLRNFGINNQQETIFNIIHCNGKTMTLKSDYAQLELEKF